MANSANFALWSPDAGDRIDLLRTVLATMQTSVDTALLGISNTLPGKTVASAAARNALYPSPVQGNKVFRSDLGYEETYFGLFNATTNPGGATPAGWYPTAYRESAPTGTFSGAAITGIEIPSAAPPVGAQTIFKSGFQHAFTTSSFGNGYMPTITFPTPFPNFCTGLSITPIQAGTSTSALWATDTVNKANFRILFPGTGVAERAFLWQATGY